MKTKVINMTDVTVWIDFSDGGEWEGPSAYRSREDAVVDTRNGMKVRDLSGFIRRRPDTIVVVTREVAATIDPDLCEQVRVPGQAEMSGGGYYAELYNPHSAR